MAHVTGKQKLRPGDRLMMPDGSYHTVQEESEWDPATGLVTGRDGKTWKYHEPRPEADATNYADIIPCFHNPKSPIRPGEVSAELAEYTDITQALLAVPERLHFVGPASPSYDPAQAAAASARLELTAALEELYEASVEWEGMMRREDGSNKSTLLWSVKQSPLLFIRLREAIARAQSAKAAAEGKPRPPKEGECLACWAEQETDRNDRFLHTCEQKTTGG